MKKTISFRMTFDSSIRVITHDENKMLKIDKNIYNDSNSKTTKFKVNLRHL